jgi:multidrug efflux pump subunit AcrB
MQYVNDWSQIMLNLTEFFLNNKKFTFVLMVFVTLFGLGGLLQLNAESFPAVDFAMAQVTTVYDGASAKVVESKITKPIEDELRGVSGIKDVRSVSQSGLSTIFIRGDIDNVVVSKLMNDLQRAVDKAKLPTDLEDPPTFLEIKSEEFPVAEIAIVGENANRSRDLVADFLKEEIEDDKNILNVREVGFRERTFEILLDAQKMEQAHVGVNEVTAAIESRNVNIPGGHLEKNKSQKLLRIEGKVHSAEELKNILIRSNSSGQAVYLKDVAQVSDGQEVPRVLASYNGKKATLLIATKKAGADTIDLVKGVDEKINRFRSKYAGEFDFVVYNNEALKVKNRVAVLASNAVQGLALVIAFLLIFLPGKIGIMASLSLPLAVIGAVGFMPSFGMNLDAITILALVIAIGMLVDNSVVISENYSRLLGNGLSPRDAIKNSIRTLWLPISITAFTTIAAFLPMLVTKGIMGQFIKFIPIIVSLSLLLSLAESFFFLPTRLEGITSKKKSNKPKKEDWFQRNFIPAFETFMLKVVRYRYLTFLAFTVVLFVSIFMMTVGNKFILFPPDQTEIYAARVTMPKSSRLTATENEIERLSDEIARVLDGKVSHIVGRTGISNMGPSDPKAKESDDVGIILIYVNDETKINVPHTEVLSLLEKIDIRDTEVEFEGMINGPPVGEAVNATFRSNDAEQLEQVIQILLAKLRGTKGLKNVQVQDVIGDQEVYVNIDYQKADRLGLNVNNVGNAIRTAISGKTVSDVNLNNKEVDLYVRFKDEYRTDLERLKNLKVIGRSGYLVPLSAFADFREQAGTPQIKRYDYKRSRTITAGIDDKIITSFAANQILSEEFEKLKGEYKGVSLVFGGEAESTNESMESLFNALILSLIGIFALLVFLLNSFLRPAIIMSTIPLGLLGFSIAFALHQRPISFLALIGVIGLGGIIVNSGIILITFIEELKAETNLSLNEVLAKASGLRLRAVVVSSLTTISGLLPTAYGIGGSDPILVPMTLAMAWGLTSGTILTLVWVPAAYGILEDLSNFTNRLMGRNGDKNSESSNGISKGPVNDVKPVENMI